MFHVKLGEPATVSMFHVKPLELSVMLRRTIHPRYATIRPLFGRVPGLASSVISLTRYTDLLLQPELRSAIAASVLGRLPIGITGLAILMLAQDTTGSFGSGGAVAASYVAGL